MKSRDILIYFSLLYKGDWAQIYNAIKNKEPIEDEKNAIEQIKKINCEKWKTLLF